jgi:PUA domain protein
VNKLKVGRRHHIKARRAKELYTKISKILKYNFFDAAGKRARIEVVELTPKGEFILLNNEAAFIQVEEEFFPTLLNTSCLDELPALTVDMGAVPYICNGADVMAPGLVKIDGDFNIGDILIVVEERFSKAIAVAKALYTANEVAEKKRGKIAITLHYIGDSFWEAFKRL